jgi:hypothetical protein
MNNHIVQNVQQQMVCGSVNPLERERTFTNLHFNSKFRDNYYNTSASNFQYSLPQPADNVVSLSLSSICIPNTWYVFNTECDSNRFIVEISGTCIPFSVFEIVIPDGNYDDCALESLLNDTFFYNSGMDNPLKFVKFSINPHSLKSVFQFIKNSPDDIEMNVKFVDIRTKAIMYTAGWTLGFRYGQYLHITKYLMSEGLFNAGGDCYLYFCLDDFNKNVNNSNVVFFDDNMMRDDVLAKIYLIDGKFAMNVDNTPDDCCNHTKTRKYFGPIDLQKIHISLLNQYGKVINLNNMDYSFSLEVAQLYKNPGRCTQAHQPPLAPLSTRGMVGSPMQFVGPGEGASTSASAVQAAAAALFAGIGLAAVAARKVVDQVDSGGESDYENSDIEFIGGGRHTRKQRL